MAGINFYTVTNPNTSAATREYLFDSMRREHLPELGIEHELPDDVSALPGSEQQSIAFRVEWAHLSQETATFVGRTAAGGSVRLEVSETEPYAPAHVSVVEGMPDADAAIEPTWSDT